MKKLILIMAAFILFASTGTFIHGQTVTTAVTPSPTGSIDKNIENLKEKIANKVSEIRRKNNKAVSGFITSKSGSSIKIKSDDSEYEVKLDDALTKYFKINGTAKKEITLEDISKDDYVIVTGVINDKTVNANSVFVDQKYVQLAGKISNVDKDTYTLKIVTASKDEYSVDIENRTKQNIMNIKTLEMERIGFSKIKEGDTVYFTVLKSAAQKDNSYSAEKILIIPQEYFIK